MNPKYGRTTLRGLWIEYLRLLAQKLCIKGMMIERYCDRKTGTLDKHSVSYMYWLGMNTNEGLLLQDETYNRMRP